MSDEEDKRYGLKPMPEIKFVGMAKSVKLNRSYETDRKRYRKVHPILPKKD